MVEKEIRHFSLEQICRSGQCFRMENIEEHESTDSCESTGEHGNAGGHVYRILAGDKYLKEKI